MLFLASHGYRCIAHDRRGGEALPAAPGRWRLFRGQPAAVVPHIPTGVSFCCAKRPRSVLNDVERRIFPLCHKGGIAMGTAENTPTLRAKAEAHLAANPSTELPQGSYDELLYELRVLLVELEMQNEALKELRERYVDLYEGTPMGYLTLTGSALIVESNISAAALFGIERKQLLDQRFDSFVSDFDLDRWQHQFVDAMAQGDRKVFELALKTGDRAPSPPSLRQVQVDCRRVMTEFGPTLRLSLTDISERNAVENQLRKFALAIEQSPESIVITNLAAEIEFVNDAFVRIAGYSREQLIGRNMRLLQSGKTPSETYVALWNELTNGRPWNGIFTNRRQDGREYVEFAIITPLRQPDGRITHYVGIKEDITGKKHWGKALGAATAHRRGWFGSSTARG